MMTHYSDIIVFLVLIDFNITKYRILHQQLDMDMEMLEEINVKRFLGIFLRQKTALLDLQLLLELTH